MRPVCGPFLIIGTLSSARLVCAEEIVLRLVDVRSGGGEKNCSVALMGGPNDNPRQQYWLTGRVNTGTDGSGTLHSHRTSAKLRRRRCIPF